MDVAFTLDNRIDGLLEAFLLLLPAMVANSTPVVFKGRRPIDMGVTFIDGRRLLGDGKTIEGFIAGLAAGTLVGLFIYLLLDTTLSLLHFSLIAAGALIGDIIGSFIKRRLGIERGRPAPVLDQLDFYLGSVAVTILMGIEWNNTVLLVMAVVSAILHVGANLFAYLTRLKNVPW
ncbi:MAG: CDP-2,3-bis-(O-geranylgeranyl)-sn-glycerol synthase [Aeropyrum sp.]|nr:CDP-2,3-bis-(O-geranylgeranyl)-sn-glycerol synthase [Aeropyrum sp.]MCE4616136.1 CDP-2,3-bis-(O-geranylgeranyl)-sn-glycerol synthase [Aeropyrum sp.]